MLGDLGGPGLKGFPGPAGPPGPPGEGVKGLFYIGKNDERINLHSIEEVCTYMYVVTITS